MDYPANREKSKDKNRSKNGTDDFPLPTMNFNKFLRIAFAAQENPSAEYLKEPLLESSAEVKGHLFRVTRRAPDRGKYLSGIVSDCMGTVLYRCEPVDR